MGKVPNGRIGKEKIMCLAIPMTITKIEGSYATAMANGVETQVNFAMMPDIKINDKVLVHAGFIIEKLDAEQAREIEETWAEYYAILEKTETKRV
jgi:hydrogenase assembly chaperone HypC/HupF